MNQEELVVEIFRALGNQTRYQIIKQLIDNDLCVNKINERINSSQPNISQHLRLMKNAGILACKKDGLNMCYHLANDDIRELVLFAEKIVSKNK